MKVLVFDVETTGKDRARDQIVELCIQLGLLEDAKVHGWRIRPSVPIHPEAQAVHGITAESLAECPPFAEVAPAIFALFSTAEVIVGYGVAFDIDMLQAELARAGLPPIDLSTKHVVDVLRLWHHVEPRTLAAAHEKFTGTPLTNAHAAGADVPATARVLWAMVERFGLVSEDWSEIAKRANPFPDRAKWLGPSNHVQWDGDHAIIAFGKHRGVRLDQVDPGFLRWAIGKDFPPHVKDIFLAALQKCGPVLVDWLVEHYPRPQQQEAA